MKLKKRKRSKPVYVSAEQLAPCADRLLKLVWRGGQNQKQIELEWVEQFSLSE